MKENLNNTHLEALKYENGVACGNCWGHQEYHDGYVDKLLDIKRGKKDNFISRFVRKYLPKSK